MTSIRSPIVADYTEAELQNELEDYVVTDVIEKYLLDFLEHYTDTRQKQTDRVGVWISGYVGSGNHTSPSSLAC